MRVLERHEPAMSNHCILCGQGLDRERMDLIIDIGRDMDLPGHPLDGRLYVGQCCLFDLAKVAGLLTATQLDQTKQYLREYRNSVEATINRVEDALTEATELVGTLPSPPNLDHLDTPRHVIVAEANESAGKRKQSNWIEPLTADDMPPF